MCNAFRSSNCVKSDTVERHTIKSDGKRKKFHREILLSHKSSLGWQWKRMNEHENETRWQETENSNGFKPCLLNESWKILSFLTSCHQILRYHEMCEWKLLMLLSMCDLVELTIVSETHKIKERKKTFESAKSFASFRHSFIRFAANEHPKKVCVCLTKLHH